MSTLSAKLILHVGANKTGTTALQSAFSLYRGKLRDLGILYPDLKLIDEATRSHWPLAAAMMNAPQDYYLLKDRGYQETEARQFAQDVLAHLEDQITSSKSRVVVLSSEALSMLQVDELERLRDYCYSRFENVSVVYFGREPVRAAVSFYQQALVGGVNILFKHLANSSNFQFGSTARKLLDVFGERLSLRVFDKTEFLRGDIIFDFLVNYLHVDRTEAKSIQQSSDINVSLSTRSAALLYSLNKVLPRRDDGGGNQVFFDSRRFVKTYDAERRPEKLVFPDEKWNAYIRSVMHDDWVQFLNCARLTEQATLFAEQVLQDERQFPEVQAPTKRDIEIWMRKQNITTLDRKSLPQPIKVQFSAGLLEKVK